MAHLTNAWNLAVLVALTAIPLAGCDLTDADDPPPVERAEERAEEKAEERAARRGEGALDQELAGEIAEERAELAAEAPQQSPEHHVDDPAQTAAEKYDDDENPFPDAPGE